MPRGGAAQAGPEPSGLPIPREYRPSSGFVLKDEAELAVRAQGLEVVGVLAICDRLAGGAEAIRDAAQAPYVALTTIDEIYPERPDRV